jgi:hypothetical protein
LFNLQVKTEGQAVLSPRSAKTELKKRFFVLTERTLDYYDTDCQTFTNEERKGSMQVGIASLHPANHGRASRMEWALRSLIPLCQIESILNVVMGDHYRRTSDPLAGGLYPLQIETMDHR